MNALLIGLVSGILGGMGIGGGAILIPAFILFINIDQHIIQGINLIYFIPTAVAALIIHAKNKYIDLNIAISIIIFGVLGAIIGSYLAVSIPSLSLRKMFGVFLFIIGVYEILRGSKKINQNRMTS